MKTSKYRFLIPFLILICIITSFAWGSTEIDTDSTSNFPRSFESYEDEGLESISQIIIHRIKAEPFNLSATLFFFFCHYSYSKWPVGLKKNFASLRASTQFKEAC